MKNVPEMAHVRAQQGKQQLKTIDRWNWSNVSSIKDRLEKEEEARVQKQAAEKQYWENRRKNSRKTWGQIKGRQRNCRLNDRVVIRDPTDLSKFHMGFVSVIHEDGSCSVTRGDSSRATQVIEQNDILLAPPEEEQLFKGARISVKFPNKPNHYMGLITDLNPDGTFVVSSLMCCFRPFVPLPPLSFLLGLSALSGVRFCRCRSSMIRALPTPTFPANRSPCCTTSPFSRARAS